MKRCQKISYGALQLLFVIQMSLSFIAFVTVVLHKNKVDKNWEEITKNFLRTALAGDISMVPTCLLVFFIILTKAHSEDRVGNFHRARPSASFYVAFVSWILDNFVAILRGIALCQCTDKSGPVPWKYTLVGNLLFVTQQCFQIYCIYQLEIKARQIREGPEWSTIRKGMYVLLAFFNTYNWMVNLSALESIAEVKQKCMEELLTPVVSHIVHTVGRAAHLAFRIECAHLFYKYYVKDKSSLEPVQIEPPEPAADRLGNSETEKGRWFGGLLASVYCGAALTSHILYAKNGEDYEMILGTGAVVITTITVFVTCSVLLYSGSQNNSVPYDGINPFENISAYIAGSSLKHMRLLLFYSITAVTYHFAFAFHLLMGDKEDDGLHTIREGFKGITCIFMAVFATWGYHQNRKLRSWCALHVMLWMILTSLFLDLAEECKSYGSDKEDNLVLYGSPLAIDFKMFVLIHALNDVTSAKRKYLLELQRNYDNTENVISGGNTELQETNPLSDSASVLSYGTISISI